MIVVREVDISRMRNVFGNIMIGEDVERLLIDNFSIPNTNNCIDVFFKEYGELAHDGDELFHFVTMFMGFVVKLAPIGNMDTIRSIKVSNTYYDNRRLILVVNYDII